jgi:hypothetical protein
MINTTYCLFIQYSGTKSPRGQLGCGGIEQHLSLNNESKVKWFNDSGHQRIYLNRVDFWKKGGLLVILPNHMQRDDYLLEPSDSFLAALREAKTSLNLQCVIIDR